MAEFEHRPHGWPKARRFVVARRFIQAEEAETTLFAMGRYIYRAWVTNLPLTPAGIWHFYDGRAGMRLRTFRGTTNSRTARRLCTTQDSNRVVRRQPALPGDRPPSI